MVDWQVTATTIYCDAVADEVTVLVYRDGQATCTGYAKYGDAAPEAKNKNRCSGFECHRVSQYREKLFGEADEKGASAQSEQ